MYKLIIDAMGGDYAPQAIIDGVVMALRECGYFCLSGWQAGSN